MTNKAFTYWSFVDPTTLPGLATYSIVAYLLSFACVKWLSPAVKQEALRQEQMKKIMLLKSDQKCGELLKKIKI